ncbi:hypothetical protein [Deinococcus cellulosilyticus]|uniref:HNH endonuclease n=1 Tax=Deinococcus cellulosilyticus (strain DSM 18568 / NBRC 106333 / KACC 11606 / 5516J-15) TaxID=1223518 RepID=A0A511MWW0_DEIC1|nr:hypothetical protein [Deinococcus cellulosilyticus]GEM45050.1 hypothetical protein DC3_06850 [Deinococcus cellulosilyticus NBRC 106333 = KACC 11606]
MIPRPELLTHPNIPKPLHGLAPREILGREWWDEQRREAYAKHHHHCWACGIHKREARYHRWLEAHESYTIDYTAGSMEMTEIVALCHTCHNFIHTGRMTALWQRGLFDTRKALYILQRGFKIVKGAGLSPFYVGAELYALILEKQRHPLAEEAFRRAEELKQQFDAQTGIVAPWEVWHLKLLGETHPTRFRNEQEWAAHYAALDGVAQPESAV